MEETLLLEKRTKNRAPSLCIGGGIRTHTVTLASDFVSVGSSRPRFVGSNEPLFVGKPEANR